MGACTERSGFEDGSIKEDRAQMVIEYLKQQEELKMRKSRRPKMRRTHNDISDSEIDSEVLENRKTRNTQALLLHPFEKDPEDIQETEENKEEPKPNNFFGGKTLNFGKGLASVLLAKSPSNEETKNPFDEKETEGKVSEKLFKKENRFIFDSDRVDHREKQPNLNFKDLIKNSSQASLKEEIPLESESSSKILQDSDIQDNFAQTDVKLSIHSPPNMQVPINFRESIASVDLEKQAFGVLVSPLVSADLEVIEQSLVDNFPPRSSLLVDLPPIEEHGSPKKIFVKNQVLPDCSIPQFEPVPSIIVKKEIVIDGNAKRPLSPRIENKRPKLTFFEPELILSPHELSYPKVIPKINIKINGKPDLFLEPYDSARSQFDKLNELNKEEPKLAKKIHGFGLGLLHDSILDKYYEDSEIRESEEILKVFSQRETLNSPRLQLADLEKSEDDEKFFIKVKKVQMEEEPSIEDRNIEGVNLEIPDYSADYLIAQGENKGIAKEKKKALRSGKKKTEKPQIDSIENIEVENSLFDSPKSKDDNQETATFTKKETTFKEGRTPDNLISTPEVDIFSINTNFQYYRPEEIMLPVIESERQSFSPPFISPVYKVGGSDNEFNYKIENSSYESPIRAESPDLNFMNSSDFGSERNSIPKIRIIGQKSVNSNNRESFNIPDIRASLNGSGIFFKQNRTHLLRKSPRKLSPELYKKNLQGKLTAEEEIKHITGDA